MAKVSVRWEAPATAAAAASGDGKGAGASSLLHVLPPEAKAAVTVEHVAPALVDELFGTHATHPLSVTYSTLHMWRALP